jgi:hypothetical protein
MRSCRCVLIGFLFLITAGCGEDGLLWADDDDSAEGNGSLDGIDGFGALTWVGGSLEITQNADLVDLDGPTALTGIGGSLGVDQNPALTSFDGLFSIDTIGGSFSVTDNPSLATAAAEALRDAVGPADIGGAITISGNAP